MDDINNLNNQIAQLVSKLERVIDNDYSITLERTDQEESLSGLINKINLLINQVRMLDSKLNDRDKELGKLKIIQKQLTTSEERFRLITENSKEWIWEVDDEGLYIYSSKAGEKVLGYTHDEIVGKIHFYDLFHPKDRARLKDSAFKVFREKLAFRDFVNRNISKNGESVWFSTSGIPLLDSEGNLLGYRGADVDVSERIRAEQAQKILLNISNALYNIESINDFLEFIYDELATFMNISEFIVATYDSEKDSVTVPYFISRELLEVAPVTMELITYSIKKQQSLFLSKAGIVELQKSGEICDGGEYPEIWMAVPIKLEGENYSIIACESFTTDLKSYRSDLKILEFISDQLKMYTDRKKNESDIINALEMAKESDRLKSVFLRTMSHELRTPLNSILGFSQIIEQESVIGNIQEYNSMIKSSGKQLLEIINDIMNATSVVGGNLSINNKIYFLNVEMQRLYNVVKNNMLENKKENLSLIFKPAKVEKGPVVEIDLDIFQRIMEILLNNAVKFTEHGYIEFGYLLKDSKNVIFYVKDSGIGISIEKQKIVFDLFRQGDDSSTRRYGGLGLGLFLAKNIAEYIGGKIWLESDRGKGSTFFVSIPCLRENEHMPVRDLFEPKGKALDLVGATILIAEDNRFNYLIIEKLLAANNVKILWAKNGLEAIEIARVNKDISMILMDIIMPEMDGITATQKIKSFRPNLPIIAVTAYNMPKDLVNILEGGLDDYLTKPINQQDLFEMIEKYLKIE